MTKVEIIGFFFRPLTKILNGDVSIYSVLLVLMGANTTLYATIDRTRNKKFILIGIFGTICGILLVLSSLGLFK